MSPRTAALTECRARLVADDVNPALANSAESAADVEAAGRRWVTRSGTCSAFRTARGWRDEGIQGEEWILDSVFPLEEELSDGAGAEPGPGAEEA